MSQYHANLEMTLNDTKSWTSNYREEVPGVIDSLDAALLNSAWLFLMDMEALIYWFDNMDTTHFLGNEGFKNKWYDVEDFKIAREQRSFTFEILKVNGDIYISVELFYFDIIPLSQSICWQLCNRWPPIDVSKRASNSNNNK